MTPDESKQLSDAIARIAMLAPALHKLRTLDESMLIAELRNAPGFPALMEEGERAMALITELWNASSTRWNSLAEKLEARTSPAGAGLH